MSKQTKKVESKKQIVTSDAPVLTLKVDTGLLNKVEDENSEIDWKGSLSLSVPGEYWIDGFMRKDEKGIVIMELQARLKDEQSKDQLNDDRGVLFRNNRKRLKHSPDYTGNIQTNKNGEFEIQGVIMTSKSKVTYMELSLIDGSEVVVSEEEMAF